jgi:hypothetical protein
MKEPDPVRFPFLGGGVIEFMFNRKEARLEPVFSHDLDFALFYAELKDLLHMKNSATKTNNPL